MGFSLGGAIGGFFGARSEQKGEKSAAAKLDRGYIAARQTIKPAFKRTRKIVRGTSQRLADQTRSGADNISGIYGRGFGAARNELQSGQAAQESAANRGFGEAQGRFDVPDVAEARRIQGEYAQGRGGFDDATLNRLKANARDEYGVAGREILRTAGGFAGDAGAPGLRAERVGGALGEIGRQRANAVRDVDYLGEQTRRDDQAAGLDYITQDAVTRGNISIEQGRAVASLKDKASGALAGLSVEEATRQGALREDELQTLLSIEESLGQSIADLTMEEAGQLAELVLAQSGAAANSRIRLGQAKGNRYRAAGAFGDEAAKAGAAYYTGGGGAGGLARVFGGVTPTA